MCGLDILCGNRSLDRLFFFCSDALSTASDGKVIVNDELGRIWLEAILAFIRYHESFLG